MGNAPLGFLEDYLNNEDHWDEILGKYFPSSVVVYKWSTHHRVIRFFDRVAKIQYLGPNTSVPDAHRVTKEFKLLSEAEGAVCWMHPKLRELDDHWVSLEMDYVDGDLLEDRIRSMNLRGLELLKIIWKIVRLSLRGVVHPQLRARHIIVKANGEICFIDFGGGEKTSLLRAFISNLRLSDIRNSPILYLLYGWIAKRGPVPLRSPAAKLQQARFVDAGTNVCASQETSHQVAFAQIEAKLIELVAGKPELIRVVPKIEFGNSILYGSWDWEPVRRAIFKVLDFQSKKVLVVGSGMGFLAIFAKACGAHVIAYEDCPDLREIAGDLSLALGWPVSFDPSPDKFGSALSHFDVVICVDPRNNEERQSALLEELDGARRLIILLTQPEEAVRAKINHEKIAVPLLVEPFNLYLISDISGSA